ncbi:MAG: hypothetical protein APR53_08770 [Methanoculleus sp. SDB]|nr:MAG: hypothetical protein APR53_08770 [Methanoculleus sp. SDB]
MGEGNPDSNDHEYKRGEYGGTPLFPLETWRPATADPGIRKFGSGAVPACIRTGFTVATQQTKSGRRDGNTGMASAFSPVLPAIVCAVGCIGTISAGRISGNRHNPDTGLRSIRYGVTNTAGAFLSKTCVGARSSGFSPVPGDAIRHSLPEVPPLRPAETETKVDEKELKRESTDQFQLLNIPVQREHYNRIFSSGEATAPPVLLIFPDETKGAGSSPSSLIAIHSHIFLLSSFRNLCPHFSLLFNSSGNKGVFQIEKIIYYVPTTIGSPLRRMPVGDT